MSNDPAAVLIDVRTEAEWNFVGVPVLDNAQQQPRFVQWITFPGGARSPDFMEVATEGLDPSQPVLFLCRSGARSQAAAEAFEAAGFQSTYNIMEGFEGDKGPGGHRVGGWKHSGLPWAQG
jgi:rhodanese-related sulfurtransferase